MPSVSEAMWGLAEIGRDAVLILDSLTVSVRSRNVFPSWEDCAAELYLSGGHVLTGYSSRADPSYHRAMRERCRDLGERWRCE